MYFFFVDLFLFRFFSSSSSNTINMCVCLHILITQYRFLFLIICFLHFFIYNFVFHFNFYTIWLSYEKKNRISTKSVVTAFIYFMWNVSGGYFFFFISKMRYYSRRLSKNIDFICANHWKVYLLRKLPRLFF